MLVLSSFSDVTCPSFLKFQFACCSLHPFTFILFLYVCYNRYNMYVGLGLVFFVSFNWSTRMTYRECITMIGYILLLKEKKRVPISKFFPQVLTMARPDTKPRVQHSTLPCGQQEHGALSHGHCSSGAALPGSWSKEESQGLKPGVPARLWQLNLHLNYQAKCPLQYGWFLNLPSCSLFPVNPSPALIMLKIFCAR